MFSPCINGELSLHQVLVADPIVEHLVTLLMFQYTSYDVNGSKMRANVDGDVAGVVVLWQDKVALS